MWKKALFTSTNSAEMFSFKADSCHNPGNSLTLSASVPVLPGDRTDPCQLDFPCSVENLAGVGLDLAFASTAAESSTENSFQQWGWREAGTEMITAKIGPHLCPRSQTFWSNRCSGFRRFSKLFLSLISSPLLLQMIARISNWIQRSGRKRVQQTVPRSV